MLVDKDNTELLPNDFCEQNEGLCLMVSEAGDMERGFMAQQGPNDLQDNT